MEFYKYHGAGNDFVLIDNRTLCFEASRERVAALCHRRTGVGADGLMLLESDEQQEFLMRYFNADGGEATMCGNGGRCITLFAHHLGIGGVQKRFRGVDGVHTATVLSAEGECGTVRLGMTEVSQMEVASDFYFLNTGSPHYVT
ncbi:MAG: diaminopimelate epimerase, partial [Alistipes sp.]|nr:diaminopimelate epimerase [Alistipes sp.]